MPASLRTSGAAPNPIQVPVNPAIFPGATGGQQIRNALQTIALRGGTLDMSMMPSPIVLDVDICGQLDVFNNRPFTFIWGPQEVRIAVAQGLRSHHHHICRGTHFVLKDALGNRVLGINGFYYPYTQVGFGGPGNGVIATAGGGTIQEAAPASANWAFLEVGQAILLHGQIPALGTDNTTLSAAVLAGDVSLPVGSTVGFAAAGTIRIVDGANSEIVTYTSTDATHFLGCTRGAMGTAAAGHAINIVIQRAVLDSFLVDSVAGSVITLGEGKTTDIAANNLTAYLGPIDIRFDGTAIFDGNKDPAVDDPNNPIGIQIEGGRFCFIGKDITFVDWDHGGAMYRISTDCELYGTAARCGRQALNLGAGFWLFGRCRSCLVDVTGTDCNQTVIVDDRTTAPQDTDNACEGCHVNLRRYRRCNIGIHLEGTLRCEAHAGLFIDPLGGASAISLSAAQWVTNNVPTDNICEAGTSLGPGVVNDIVVGAGVEAGNNHLVVHRRGGVVSIVANTGQSATSLLTPPSPINLTYGATVNIDASRSEEFILSVTNGVAFTIANPTNLPHGRRMAIAVLNSSGGVMGAVTFGTMYRLSGAFVAPANGQLRIYEFISMGAFLRETYRSAADQSIA